MPRLVEPGPAVHRSFVNAMTDFKAEGRGAPDDTDSALGRSITEFSSSWDTTEGFAEFLASLHREGDTSYPAPEGWVHSTTFWWVDGSDFLGSIRIRHTLTPYLLEVSGHIGYDVAPKARLKGHGTAMLAAALPHAASLGIASVLITCDKDNVGSAKVIEANGGKLEDERHGKLRYWVATA